MLAKSSSICLRRFQPADLVAFQAYRQDPDIACFQDWTAMTDAQAKGFLAEMEHVSPLMTPGNWTQIAVADAKTDALMGDMGLFLSEDGAEAELGITLAKTHQRKGHATTAMRLAMKLLLHTTDAQKIICGADQRNIASIAMIKRLRFRFTHSEDMSDGRLDHVYELLREEVSFT